MVDSNLSFVRTEMLQGQTPPLAETGRRPMDAYQSLCHAD